MIYVLQTYRLLVLLPRLNLDLRSPLVDGCAVGNFLPFLLEWWALFFTSLTVCATVLISSTDSHPQSVLDRRSATRSLPPARNQ